MWRRELAGMCQVSVKFPLCSNSCPLNWWCHLTLGWSLLFLPSIFPSIKVFSNKLAVCIRWPEYWGFSFSIRPSNEYSGLISFRIDKGKGERWIGYPPLNTNQSLNMLTFCQRHYCFGNGAHLSEPCRAGTRTWPSTAGRCPGRDLATWGGQSHFYHHRFFLVGSS